MLCFVCVCVNECGIWMVVYRMNMPVTIVVRLNCIVGQSCVTESIGYGSILYILFNYRCFFLVSLPFLFQQRIFCRQFRRTIWVYMYLIDHYKCAYVHVYAHISFHFFFTGSIGSAIRHTSGQHASLFILIYLYFY